MSFRAPSVAIALATNLVAATQLFAGYAARESWIPVVGHASGFAGRGFYTTVYLTDTSGAKNEVSLSFFASAQPHRAPQSITLQLGPDQTSAIEIGPQLVGSGGAIGALRIRSSGPVVGTARVYSRGASDSPAAEVGTVLNAIPAQFAIGTGESTLLHGPPANGRYKLYAAETNGFALYFSVKPMMSNTNERRLYLSPYEQRSWDLSALFPGVQPAALRLTGINGSGKIIAAGTSIADQSQDFTGFEMSLPVESRHRMRWPELAAYAVVAIAIAASAIYRLKQ